jgi:predicted RNA polymerase sigma factor
VDDTDWRRIAALYTVLAYIAPSPVVDLNRAVAIGMSEGPQRGLALVEELDRRNALPGYPELDAVRATFLRQLKRPAESRAAFERAATSTNNSRTRRLYLQQAEQAAGHGPEERDSEEHDADEKEAPACPAP